MRASQSRHCGIRAVAHGSNGDGKATQARVALGSLSVALKKDALDAYLYWIVPVFLGFVVFLLSYWQWNLRYFMGIGITVNGIALWMRAHSAWRRECVFVKSRILGDSAHQTETADDTD